MSRLLWHLLAGTRGGLKRAELLALVLERPYNAHQLAQQLGIDYKTARHHLRVLERNELIVASTQEGLGTLYFPSGSLLAQREAFIAIWEQVGKSVKPPPRPG